MQAENVTPPTTPTLITPPVGSEPLDSLRGDTPRLERETDLAFQVLSLLLPDYIDRDLRGNRSLLRQDVVDGQYVVQLFKALKQNLTVKTFVGTSENALRIQIWTALIALLLLKWLHHLSKANWSLSNLASMLRLNLFTYRELTQWIDNPMGTPPLIPAAEQLTLALA